MIEWILDASAGIPTLIWAIWLAYSAGRRQSSTPVVTQKMSVKDVFDTLTADQKNVVYFMVGEALKDQDLRRKE